MKEPPIAPHVVLARLAVEALLRHWQLQLRVNGPEVVLPHPDVECRLTFSEAGTAVGAQIEAIVGRVLLRKEARIHLDNLAERTCFANQRIALDAEGVIRICWNGYYRQSSDAECIANAMLNQIEAASVLHSELGEDCLMQCNRLFPSFDPLQTN